MRPSSSQLTSASSMSGTSMSMDKTSFLWNHLIRTPGGTLVRVSRKAVPADEAKAVDVSAGADEEEASTAMLLTRSCGSCFTERCFEPGAPALRARQGRPPRSALAGWPAQVYRQSLSVAGWPPGPLIIGPSAGHGASLGTATAPCPCAGHMRLLHVRTCKGTISECVEAYAYKCAQCADTRTISTARATAASYLHTKEEQEAASMAACNISWAALAAR